MNSFYVSQGGETFTKTLMCWCSCSRKQWWLEQLSNKIWTSGSTKHDRSPLVAIPYPSVAAPSRLGPRQGAQHTLREPKPLAAWQLYRCTEAEMSDITEIYETLNEIGLVFEKAPSCSRPIMIRDPSCALTLPLIRPLDVESCSIPMKTGTNQTELAAQATPANGFNRVRVKMVNIEYKGLVFGNNAQSIHGPISQQKNWPLTIYIHIYIYIIHIIYLYMYI